MEEFDPIDVEFLINSEEVKRDAQKVKADLMDIGQTAEKTTTKVNAQMASLSDVQKQHSKALADRAAAHTRFQQQLATNQEAWNRKHGIFDSDALSDTKNELEGIAEQVNEITTGTEALEKGQNKSDTAVKSSTRGLLGWGAALLGGLELIKAYGPEIINFIKRFFNLEKATEKQVLAQENLKKAFDSVDYSNAIAEITELEQVLQLAKEGTIDKTVAISKYNEVIGDTAGKATNLLEVEEGLAKNTDNYIDFIFKRAAANLALKEAVDEAIAAEKRREFLQAEDFKAKDLLKLTALAPFVGTLGKDNQLLNQIIGASGIDFKAAEENAKKAGDVLETQSKSLLEIYKEKLKEAEEAGKLLGLSVFNLDDDDAKKAFEARKRLLEQISSLDKEYARKALDNDAEELQALRDKFSKIRQLVEEFNAQPANARVKIDTAELDAILLRAEEELTFKQQTRALRDELTAQKSLFEDFEEAKKQFGVTKAREMYAAQLGEFDSYAALLKQKVEENEPSFTAVAQGTATGGQADRVRLLNKEKDDEKSAQTKKYNELLAGLLDYEQQRKKLLENYQEQRKLLLEGGNVAEAEQLKRNIDQQLAELDDAYAKGTDEYKALIRGVETLSDTAARAVIVNARRMIEALIAAGRISEETAREIIVKIDELEQEVDGRSANKLELISSKIYEISNAFLNLGDSLEVFDAGLADTITTIGELAQVAGDAAGAVAKFSAGDIIGGIAGAINAISGIFRIGAKSRESARQAQAELLKLQQESFDGEIRLNEVQRLRNQTKAEEVALTLRGIEAQREALRLSEQQLKADMRRIEQELAQEEFITNSRTEKYGGFLGIGRKTKVVNDYASLLGLTFEEIEKLYERGKLTDRAEELFEQLRRLREEGEDVNALIGNLEQQTREVFTGTTGNAIADSIIEGLKQGYDSFEDFAGDVEALLQQSILNAIKFNTLEEPIQRLYEQFADFAQSEGEITQAEADAIRAQYEAQVKRALEQYEQLSGILDENLIDSSFNRPGLQGAIRRELTEQTASELTGLFRGQYDVTKRHFELAERHFELERQHVDATLNIMAQSARIEQNTASTVLELQTAVTELRTISKNTKKGQTGRDLGVG